MGDCDFRLACSALCVDRRPSAAGFTANTMSRIEIIPPELLYPEMVEEFLVWLLALDVPWLTKKEILCEWCAYVGYPLTAELVARLGPEE